MVSDWGLCQWCGDNESGALLRGAPLTDGRSATPRGTPPQGGLQAAGAAARRYS